MKKLAPKAQGNLIMFAAICIFGLNIPVSKYLYSEGLITPFGLTAMRMSFAAVAFWITSLFVKKEKVAKKDLLILMLGGICGTVLNQGLFAYGLGQTSPVDASIITTSSPLFAMIIAAIILKEPITWMKAGGVFVGGFGALFLIYSSHAGAIGEGSSFVGNLAIVSAQFFYAFYLVITRPLSMKYSPVTIMKWIFLFASAAFLPFSYKEAIAAPLFQQSETLPYMLLFFCLFGATYITFFLLPLAQQRIRPTTISMYNNIQPLIASVVAILIMGEHFTINKLIAAIFIFGGVYLVTMSKSKADMEAEIGHK